MTSQMTLPKPEKWYWTELHEPLADVFTSIDNRIEREPAFKLNQRAIALRVWLLSHLRIARHSFLAVVELWEKREACAQAVHCAIPAIARGALESVFNIAYVMERDSAKRLVAFWKANWAALEKEFAELTDADRDNAHWQDWIAENQRQRAFWAEELNNHGMPLTEVEKSNYRKVPYWPNPGKLAKACSDTKRKNSIDALTKLYYGELSAAAHLSATGMMRQGGIFAPGDNQAFIQSSINDHFLTALTTTLCLASQLAVDVIKDHILAKQIIKIWEFPDLPRKTRDAYDRCYREALITFQF